MTKQLTNTTTIYLLFILLILFVIINPPFIFSNILFMRILLVLMIVFLTCQNTILGVVFVFVVIIYMHTYNIEAFENTGSGEGSEGSEFVDAAQLSPQDKTEINTANRDIDPTTAINVDNTKIQKKIQKKIHKLLKKHKKDDTDTNVDKTAIEQTIRPIESKSIPVSKEQFSAENVSAHDKEELEGFCGMCGVI